uniref:7TM_GPCR_Srx domain-containing protein n=1 Tax=Panagrellus redivivus TaxID=6233 RepID=A0A7E4VWX9_PANRE
MSAIVSHFHAEASFDADDPKYRSCCHLYHSVTGVRIILGITCGIILIELWHLAICITFDEYGDLPSWIWNIVVNCILAFTLFYAQQHENFLFLLPCLVIKATGVTIRLIIFGPLTRNGIDSSTNLSEINFVSFFTTVFSSSNDITLGESKLTNEVIICEIIIVIYHLWIVYTVMKCSKYYHDKHASADAFYTDMRTMVLLTTSVANPENGRRSRNKHVTII